MRIRGTFLRDYVQLVLDNRDLEWNRFLNPDDWEVVNGMIIPTAWYPAQTMAHIGRGIFEMRVNKSYPAVRMHGRARATDHFDEATKHFLIKGDPHASLKTYAMIAGRYIDELKIEMGNSGPGMAELRFFPVDGIPAWDLFREIQAGTVEKLVELNGGKGPAAVLLAEERAGREVCVIRVTWT